jgi:hypothetical protein
VFVGEQTWRGRIGLGLMEWLHFHLDTSKKNQTPANAGVWLDLF